MKKYLFLVVTMLMVSVVASAQFMNAGGSSSSGFGIKSAFSGEDAPSKFNTFSFSYHPMKLITSIDKKSSSESMNGFSLEWNGNTKITKSVPLYFGYGLGVQYSFDKESDKVYSRDVDVATRFLSAKIPFELLYRFDIPSTKIAIAPYVGFDAVIHLLGKKTTTTSYGGKEEVTTCNFFDEDDMLSSDATYRRFNIDWHIGAKFMFNDKWFLGAAYEGQVLKLNSYDDYSIGFGQANISVGLVF